MSGIDNKKHIKCPCCGAVVPFGKFCPECGAALSEIHTECEPPVSEVSVNAPEQKIGFFPGPDIKVFAFGEVIDESNMPDQSEKEEVPLAVDDSGLTLVGDFCKKTMATIGGDGYDEIVLYENEEDGSFQIHTYSKYVYMQKEIHHSYKAKAGAYDALLGLAEKLHLDEYEGKRGFGLCGGMYICKYKKDGVLHRVTTDNFEDNGASIIMQVGNLLGSFIGEEIFA